MHFTSEVLLYRYDSEYLYIYEYICLVDYQVQIVPGIYRCMELLIKNYTNYPAVQRAAPMQALTTL